MKLFRLYKRTLSSIVLFCGIAGFGFSEASGKVSSASGTNLTQKKSGQNDKSGQADEAVLFRFKFKKDDQSRVLSTVEENVYVNGRLNHKATILNRISSVVTDVNKAGDGKCEAVFMTSESSTGSYGKNYVWGQEYDSIFTRSPLGKYDIDDIYFMPTVRDVPLFPENAVKPGETWSSEGHEAHDMRITFGIDKPFKVPFNAEYKYAGKEYDAEQDKTFHLIEVKYNLYFESPVPSTALSGEDLNYPAVTMGHSSQKIWWDNEKGMIDHYSEDFRIVIETFYGDTLSFTGTAHAEVQEFTRVSTEENIRKIKDFVGDSGIQDIDVKKSDKGLTISIENIQFEPDSSRLMESEKKKLRKIAEILKQFDNDLLITGHCADRGTKKNQMKISEDRAVSVAEFLSELDVRNPNCIFTLGKGATEPVDSNLSEQGRKRNRRVEITLMDK